MHVLKLFNRRMGKRRILILIHYLEIGGAESALIGLLQTLDPDRVDVDLFLYYAVFITIAL